MGLEQNYAMWTQGAGAVNDAHDYRRLLGRLMAWDNAAAGGLATEGAGNGGVTRPGDFAVVQRAAGADVSVDVAAGGAVIFGTENVNHGAYFAYNEAVVNVPLTPAHATLGRIDVVGIQIRDAEYGGTSTNDARIVAVTGTAAAGTPAVPAVPENFLTLAQISVPAADTTITNNQITDLRRRVAALGGMIVATSTTRPTVGLWGGMHLYETDTGDMLVADAGGFWTWTNGPGQTMDWFAATVPAEWDFYRGQAISRATYSRLFARLGTLHGTGDGTTTFNLPDSRGRAIIGRDDMGGAAAGRVTTGVSGLNAASLGAAGGHQATQAHQHTPNAIASFLVDGVGSLITLATGDFGSGHYSPGVVPLTSSYGNGNSQNVQPSLVANKIMRLR